MDCMFCDNEAREKVEVSLDVDSVETYHLCHMCKEAFDAGCQHGHFRAVRNLNRQKMYEAAGAIERVLYELAPTIEIEVVADLNHGSNPDIIAACATELQETLEYLTTIGGEHLRWEWEERTLLYYYRIPEAKFVELGERVAEYSLSVAALG